MSDNEISTTNFKLNETAQKNLLFVGLIACGIHALWALISIIVGLTTYSPGFLVASRIISNLLTIVMVVGFFVIIYLMNNENQIKLALYIAFAIYTLIHFVGIFTNLYSADWALFVIRILVAIPTILLYGFYWKDETMAKILLIVTSIRLVLRLVISGIWIASPFTNVKGLAITRDVLTVVLLILIGIWFYQFKQRKPSDPISTGPTKSVGETASVETATKAGYSEYTKSHGLTRTIPTLLFWCETCNKQAKNIKLNSMKPEDIEKEHMCPDCNSVVKAFWLAPNQSSYIRFLIGLSLFGGAIIVMAINAAFGWLGWAPYMFAGIFVIAALAINWNMLTRNFGIEGPPPNATTVPSAEPAKEFTKELIITSVIALVGGAISFGIIVGLSSLF